MTGYSISGWEEWRMDWRLSWPDETFAVIGEDGGDWSVLAFAVRAEGVFWELRERGSDDVT